MLKLLPTLLATAVCSVAPAAAFARQPADLAGSWDLALDRTGSVCRVLLRKEKSDKGDFFLGMPSACRHAMPGIASVGRWSMLDDDHLALRDPAGAGLVTLATSGRGFVGAGPDGTFTLTPAVRANGGTEPVSAMTVEAAPAVADGAADRAALFHTVASRRSRAEVGETASELREDLPGRYAVLRDKRDTGCMITLDKARVSGGERAQLAPGCRDQGIVIFDPLSWQVVKGDLVLTARAGHKARLEKQTEGHWAKDTKDGSKPLGLKKL